MMKAAITQAKIAYKKGEVPIGCVIARGDEIVVRSRNSKIGNNDSLAHAEMKAIEKAQKKLGITTDAASGSPPAVNSHNMMV